MASRVMEKLEKHLECAICLERYKEPKVLSCLHSYCKSCLERLVTADHMITCPECRKETEVPTGDVTRLQTSFLINNLLSFEGDGQSRKRSSCVKHDGELVKLFCGTCNQPICGSCTVVDHRNHKHLFLKDVVLDEKEEIVKSITKAKTNIPVYQSAIESIEERERNVRENWNFVCQEVDNCIDEHVAILEGKRMRLKEELKEEAIAQIDQLKDQKESVSMSLEVVESGVEFADQALARGSDVEVLTMKKQIIEQMKELGLLAAAPPKLPERIMYKLAANSPFGDKAVEKMAKISEDGEFLLSMLGGEPGVIYTTRAKQTCNFVITPRNDEAAAGRRGEVKVRIKKPEGVNAESPFIKDNPDGTSSFSYRPNQTGSYGVEILLNGKPTCGSPLAWDVQPAFCLDQIVSKLRRNVVLPSKCSFQGGQHSWKIGVRVDDSKEDAEDHRIGVTHSGGVAQSFWEKGRCYHLYDDGGQERVSSSIQYYERGDVFVCYLNLDKGQLIICNERTKQSDSFLHCQPPVSPLVYPERKSYFDVSIS